ncbi:MAG TPA: hypothetical protein DDX84_04110 [Nitrospiraceae bacterium]|nr:hypothetical protein [Nitrospiraceae bacterium]
MEKISEQIIKIIGDTEKDFEGKSNYEELRKASESYNEMVKMGLIKKRGYNLLSIDQTNIKQPTFNSQQLK